MSFTFCCLVRLCVLEGSEHSPLDNNPAWLFYPDSHHKENLEHITVPVLQTCVKIISKLSLRHKEELVAYLLMDFLSFCIQFLAYHPNDLQVYPSSPDRNRCLLIISDIFEQRYGEVVAAAFRTALCPAMLMHVQYPLPKQPESLTWISSSKHDLIVLIYKKLLRSEFLSVLHNILWQVRACHKWIIKSCAFALVELMVDHGCYLLHLT